MSRLFQIFSFLIFAVLSLSGFAQTKGFDPEKLYRPVYGYVIDTCSNLPLSGVLVYGFDSAYDAEVGKEALKKSLNPLKVKIKGEVVETRTDATGRYMLPALSKGAIVFWFKDSKTAVVKEIAGRNEVSLGKKEKRWSVSDLDLDKYAVTEDLAPKKLRPEPVGVELTMDFNCYIPYLGDKAGDSRIKVERRVIDLETGELLACHVSVARDGRQYHRKSKSLTDKKVINDTLLSLAEQQEPLSEKTSSVKVSEKFSTEPWKDRCFRIGYFVIHENASDVRHLDTLYMLTNRIGRPLKYLEYRYEPYTMIYTPTDEYMGRQFARKLVLEGEYQGRLPEVLQDPDYILKEMHVKAEVSSRASYQGNIAKADSLTKVTLEQLKATFLNKLTDEVRMTRTSASSDVQAADRVTYRLVFRTTRNFSGNHYAELLAAAKENELDSLCRRAIDESVILEGTSWDYAANILASSQIRRGEADPALLAPFVQNSNEILANQIMILLMNGRCAEAAELSEMLPDKYAFLRELAKCKAGTGPESEAAVEILGRTSLRNKVVMDLYTGEIDDDTFASLEELPADDPYRWYLKAVCLCVLYGNDMADMTTCCRSESCTVYDEVKACLAESFRLNPSLKESAVLDGDINEYALKEVLGVFVL